MYNIIDIDDLSSDNIIEIVKEQTEMCDIISKIHSMGILKLNNNYEFEVANSAWFEINNAFNESKLRNKQLKWMDNIALPYHKDLMEHVKKLDVEKEFTMECEIITKDDEKRWVMILGNRINGGGKGYSFVYIDITKRKTFLPKLMEIKNMDWK